MLVMIGGEGRREEGGGGKGLGESVHLCDK